ncbi:hypothetical protein [Sphingobacterium paucimobilis]|uniref:Uncharacterized protein n=1 Tax=Sphingobacterium paucimobilis HER1398 TaxID=1346330 RepID=U2HHT3_9SPHI|nr:hypothetical protein [Sphingobacterium paucimobilis]ERJ61316.1 hypothetical protein M472_21410 [Sphingobacterium paucimobilis HER1398]
MVKLTTSAIFTINMVKLRRLVKGRSARDLSASVSSDPNLISGFESMVIKSQYPHHVLSSIANELNDDIRLYYPPDEDLLEDDGSRFVKEIISLSNIDDCTLVINGMIDAGCFIDGKSKDDTAIYLFEQGKPNALIIEQALKIAEKANKLSLRDGKYFS